MKILLINRFSPPDPAPTATLLGELGDDLEGRGWEVVHLNGATGGYHDKSEGGSRALGYLMAHLRILWRGLRSPHPDLILCLSDPPCLIVTSWILSRFHSCKLVHWCMDLYPEIAVALGEVPKGLLSDTLTKLNRRCYAAADLVIGLDEDMSARLSTGTISAKTVPPWPPKNVTAPAQMPPAPERFRWLYSGNLGLAHEWRCLIEAQRLLELRGIPIELVFQGRGAALDEAKQAASDLEQCSFHDYAPDDSFLESLLTADAHVVTLHHHLTGMLRPSKLSLLLHLPLPIIWVGNPQCSPARDARQHQAGGTSFSPDQVEELALYLEKLVQRREELRPSTMPSVLEASREQREKATDQIHDWLDNILS